MIIAAMLYALAVGLAISIVAWAAERLIVPRGLARRFIWIAALAASVIVPVLLMLKSTSVPVTAPVRTPATIVESASSSDGLNVDATRSESSPTHRAHGDWPTRPELDGFLAWLWVGLSSALILRLVAASWLLNRKMRDWPVQTLDGQVIRITPSTGPAVCGVFAPSVLIPRWAATAPEPVRELILLHEQSHLRANDPFLLWAALLLVVLTPWNVPIWWQLHRLRFAIEVDCDARVMNATDQDAVTYGEVLLTIGQRISNLPIGSMALNESSSQLERRIKIMVIETQRSSVLVTGALVMLVCAVVAGAASLNAPSLGTDKPAALQGSSEILMPPPKWLDLRWSEIDASLQALLQRQYPQLLSYEGNELPLIEVLFKPDGGVERSELRMLGGMNELRYSNVLFRESDVGTEQLAYVQPREIQPPSPAKRVYFHFGERNNPSNTYAYANSLGDSGSHAAEWDRYVLTRYFPDVAADRATGGAILWIVLDGKGRVLESGREAASPELNNSAEILGRVMARFPQIRTNAGRMTAVSGSNGIPLKDAEGNQLLLNYIWLEADSPMPGSWAR